MVSKPDATRDEACGILTRMEQSLFEMGVKGRRKSGIDISANSTCSVTLCPHTYGVETTATCCVAFPVELGRPSTHPGRPTGNKPLRRVVADGDRAERRGTALGDEGRRSGQVPERRIKTNERGRVLCSLCHRKIGTVINLRDKSFTNFDYGKSLISGEKLELKIRDLRMRNSSVSASR